ncbi:MAG: site-2 protease family protein [Clostridiales bacterium]|nr:site-2 protease family protein [Clostridiales bacterium]
MFRYLTSGGDIKSYLIQLLLSLPIIVLSLTVHEYSHGLIAKKLGDPTADNLGRLTLNPLKHLDPMGFLAMLLFGFGWAKPVPVNTRNFKNPRRDMALTAIAGPVSNLILAVIFALLYEITIAAFSRAGELSGGILSFASTLALFLWLGSYFNVMLAVFNLLPIPPFDGSRFFYVFLPVKWYFKVMKYERYIMMGIMAVLLIESFLLNGRGLLLGGLARLSNLILDGIYRLLELLPFFG